jgi:transcriptional regulator with XRE-family HTH domain
MKVGNIEKKLDLRVYRNKLGLTQVQLAEMLGLNSKYLSMIESGTKPLTDKMVKKLELLELSRHPVAPEKLPLESMSDVATSERLSKPAWTLTRRERCMQHAARGHDKAKEKSADGYWETLMLNASSVVSDDSDEQRKFHLDQAKSILDKLVSK